MTREIILGAFCVLATIGIGWLADHPNKVAGTIVLIVAFGILVLVARLRHSGQTRSRFSIDRKPPPRQKE